MAMIWKKTVLVVTLLAFVGMTTFGCATNQKTGTLVGAGGGAAIGAAVTKGSIWGVLIGAAVGGAAGNLIGKNMDKQAKELKQAVPSAEVERVGEGINLTFDSSLLFALGSADISPSYQKDLAAAATVMQKYPDTNILIEGHTDSTGSDAVNQPLSERRATAVSKYLASQGVAAGRLSTKGYGSSQPKVPNDTKENQAKNRRVELAITANDKMVAQAKDGELKE
jgi:outer membrane protein OmpA-like peptidoglycan-associated protein